MLIKVFCWIIDFNFHLDLREELKGGEIISSHEYLVKNKKLKQRQTSASVAKITNKLNNKIR